MSSFYRQYLPANQPAGIWTVIVKYSVLVCKLMPIINYKHWLMPFGYTYLHLDWRKSLILLVNTLSLPTLVGITIIKLLLSSAPSSSDSLSSLSQSHIVCFFTKRLESWVWANSFPLFVLVVFVGFLGVLPKSLAVLLISPACKHAHVIPSTTNRWAAKLTGNYAIVWSLVCCMRRGVWGLLIQNFISLSFSRRSFKIDPIYLQFLRKRMVLAIPLFFSSWL